MFKICIMCAKLVAHITMELMSLSYIFQRGSSMITFIYCYCSNTEDAGLAVGHLHSLEYKSILNVHKEANRV